MRDPAPSASGLFDRKPDPLLPNAAVSARQARLLTLTLWAAGLEGLTVFLTLILRQPAVGAPAPLGHLPFRALLLGFTVALTAGLFAGSIEAWRNAPWRARIVAWVKRLAAREGLLLFVITAFYASVAGSLVAFFGTSLRLNPRFGNLLHLFLDRGLLPLPWLALLTLHALIVVVAFSGAAARRWLKAFITGGLALAFLLLYWYGAEGQLLFYNLDMRLTDQSAYMEYARLLKQSGYAYTGDFNRMPVYPFLLSLAWRPGMTDSAFFLAAKYFNLFLSMLLLAGLAALFHRRHGPLAGLALFLIVAFTVFVYKAGWVQAELLFYFLNACLFLLMWRSLKEPSLAAALATGLVAGVAHLTKASIAPGLVLFGGLALLRGLWLWRVARRPGGSPPPPGSAIRRLLVVPVTAVAFLAVVFPYIRVSHRLTGRYFYNVNSTFYVWYDSWEQAEEGTKAHGDRLGWPDMPPEEIPSLAKYLREHTVGQMVDRVVDGERDVIDHVLRSYGYIDYLAAYGAVLLLAVVLKARRAWGWVSQNPFLSLFFVAYFPGYTLLYFWYAPIAAGDRLILAQFIPLLVVLAGGVHMLLAEDRIRFRGRSIAVLTVVNLALLGLASAKAVYAITQGVYVLRGGG